MTADFRTLNISNMSLGEWNEIISNHVYAKYKVVDESGRYIPGQYIRINSIGELTLFESKKSAKERGFDNNIPVSQIIKVTSQKIAACQDPSDKYHAQFRMKVLLHKKLTTAHLLTQESSPIRKLFSSSKTNRLNKLQGEIIEIQTFLTKLNPQGNISQPGRLSYDLKELQKATVIKRFLHGNADVYFIPESPLVLKLRPNPLPYIFADRFFQKLDFPIPSCCCLSKESEVGEIAFKTLKSLVSSDFKQRLGECEDSSKKALIIKQKRIFEEQLEYPYVITMRKMEGTRLTELSQDQINILFSNQPFLINLGEMIFLDCFIGNSNRISLTGCDTDNFLLLSDSKASKRIALVSHHYSLSSTTFNAIAQNISQLFDRTTDVIPTIIARLQEQLKFEIDKKYSSDCIYEGILQGAKSLVKKFSTPKDDEVYKILDTPSVFNLQFPDLPDAESFFNMLTYVDQIRSNSKKLTKKQMNRSSSSMNISPSSSKNISPSSSKVNLSHL